jgi:hypothetical protein
MPVSNRKNSAPFLCIGTFEANQHKYPRSCPKSLQETQDGSLRHFQCSWDHVLRCRSGSLPPFSVLQLELPTESVGGARAQSEVGGLHQFQPSRPRARHNSETQSGEYAPRTARITGPLLAALFRTTQPSTFSIDVPWPQD